MVPPEELTFHIRSAVEKGVMQNASVTAIRPQAIPIYLRAFMLFLEAHLMIRVRIQNPLQQ